MSFYKQYLKVKAENADAIVMFRIGDFYEMFGEDATLVSRELDLTLTTRDCGEHGRVPINTRLGTEQPQDGLGEVEDLRDFEAVKIPMCGVPKHSVESYIKKLIEKGYRTAVCEPTVQDNKPTEQAGRVNLTANGKEQTVLKEYLEQNASDILVGKINNGVRVEKDGKQLVSKKTLESFMKYACDEARKQAEKGARSACVEDATVFGWLMHYFEEDSIEGVLYNEDGTEYKPTVKTKDKKSTTKTAKTTTPAKAKSTQPTIFDIIESRAKEENAEVEELEEQDEESELESEVDESEIDENEIAEVDEDDNDIDEVEGEADEITDEDEVEIPSGLRKIDDDHWVDDDGVVYESTDAANSEPSIPDVFVKLFGDKLIAR